MPDPENKMADAKISNARGRKGWLMLRFLVVGPKEHTNRGRKGNKRRSMTAIAKDGHSRWVALAGLGLRLRDGTHRSPCHVDESATLSHAWDMVCIFVTRLASDSSCSP